MARGRSCRPSSDLGEPEQGGRPRMSSAIPNMPTFVAGADTNTPFLPICAVRQAWIDGGDRYLFPTDELGGGRQLVFIADVAGIAAKEVEVDKDRVVWTVGLHVQGQQGEDPQGEGRADRREVGIPDVSSNLAGDRQVMTGGAIEHQRAITIGRNDSVIGQRGIRLDRDRIVARQRGGAPRLRR